MSVTPAEASTQRATDEDYRRQIMVAHPPAPRQGIAPTPPAPAIPAPARHDHESAAIVSRPEPTRAAKPRAVPADTIPAAPARQVIPAAQGAPESRPGDELPRPVPVADAEPARTAPPTRAEGSQPAFPPLPPASVAMGPEPDRPLLAAAETTSPGISTHRSDAPATNSQPPATIPEAPRPVPQQISAAVHALGASGSTEIRLSPDELGQVRMTLLPDGDTMRVAFTAERPETLDLLRRHVSDLAAELRGLGYHSAEFSFGGDPRGDSQRRARPDGPRSYADTPSAVTIRPEPDAASRSTLDLRL